LFDKLGRVYAKQENFVAAEEHLDRSIAIKIKYLGTADLYLSSSWF